MKMTNHSQDDTLYSWLYTQCHIHTYWCWSHILQSQGHSPCRKSTDFLERVHKSYWCTGSLHNRYTRSVGSMHLDRHSLNHLYSWNLNHQLIKRVNSKNQLNSLIHNESISIVKGFCSIGSMTEFYWYNVHSSITKSTL